MFKRLTILLTLSFIFGLSTDARLNAQNPSSAPTAVSTLLSKVPEGASWQDVPADLRRAFEERAQELLKHAREAWGREGLESKAKTLLESPTQQMLDNIDVVLSVKFASELPDGVKLSRDVSNPELKRMILRVYLAEMSDRSFVLLDHPEFRGWDGLPIKENELLDHQQMEAMARYMAETEERLRKIPNEALTPTEQALRDKSYFTTRLHKHFTKPAVGQSGSFGFASVYKLPRVLRPFANDEELLDAYNSSMFAEFRDVNKGSLQSFVYDYESEFDAAWLTSQGLSPELAGKVLKLANLYRTRVLAHPDRNQPYIVYSPEERAANWDQFTAKMIANADGKETMESYAAAYVALAEAEAEKMRRLAQQTVEQLFPRGGAELTDPQRAVVSARIKAATKPAAIMETIHSALDEATGAKVASEKFKAAVAKQEKLGGYARGEAVRPADEKTVNEMWEIARNFIKREYRGYPVDIGALVPERPTILSSSEGCFAIGGSVSIGLKNSWFKASLYSTILHEIKHAIDQKSRAAVEGAAWEGAATSVETQIWPLFIKEAMGGNEADQLIAQLVTAVDDVRFVATTDATLKTFLRPAGGPDPDSFEYAKQIVAGYGYTDEKILNLRAKRANASIQYLQYHYGLVMYLDLLKYLQEGVGPTPRVDAYLLQACGMPSPKKNQATIDRLKASIGKRR